MTKTSEHDFLVAGARDFLKASAAIAKFGGEIYSAGVRVLKRQATKPTSTMDIPLAIDRVKAYPKEGYVRHDADGTGASIGCFVPVGNSSYSLYIWWRTSDDDQRGHELCSAVLSIECNSAAGAERLYAALRDPSNGNVKRDGYEIYTEKPLTPEDFGSLEQHFQELAEQWAAYAARVGGLTKFLKAEE